MTTNAGRGASAPTMQDVAALAGVASATVSNALRRPHVLAPETLRRVREAVDVLGYRALRRTRVASLRRTHVVGMVAADGGDRYWSEVVRGAEDEAIVRGLRVVHGRALEQRSRERLILAHFEDQNVRGILAAAHATSLPRLRELAERGIPTVLIDSTASGFGSVSVDHVDAGRMAAAHLLDSGCRRLLFVGSPQSSTRTRDRHEGVRRAVAGRGGAVLDRLSPEDSTLESGALAARAVLAMDRHRRSDGIVVADDLVAIGLFHGLRAAGIDVPAEIGIIGFGDDPLVLAAGASLTTVAVPSTSIGRISMKLLLDREHELGGTAAAAVPCELIIRESTRVIPRLMRQSAPC